MFKKLKNKVDNLSENWQNYKFEPNGSSITEKWKVSIEWVNLISRFSAAKEKIKLDMDPLKWDPFTQHNLIGGPLQMHHMA